jgi:hypothetical protein
VAARALYLDPEFEDEIRQSMMDACGEVDVPERHVREVTSLEESAAELLSREPAPEFLGLRGRFR